MTLPVASLALASETVDELVSQIADRVVERVEVVRGHDWPGWLDSSQAARYLGLTPNALHKHTSAREITFSQDGDGAKCWFRRGDLDAFREQHLVERLETAVNLPGRLP